MNDTKLTIVSLRTNCLPFSAPGLKMTCPPPKSGWEMNLWTRSGSSFCAGLPAGFEKFNMPGTWKISGRKTSWLIALRFFGKTKKTIWDHELKVDSVGINTIMTTFIEMWRELHNEQWQNSEVSKMWCSSLTHIDIFVGFGVKNDSFRVGHFFKPF